MAASAKRKQEEKHLKMLREMTSLPHNRKCFDCDQRGPTYANMTVGSFVCTSCSGILRGLNPPNRVKSISMTTFSQQEIEFLQKHGNEVCKHIWLGLYNEKSTSVPDFREPQKVKEFLQDKYEKKRWYVPPDQAKVASVHASISGSSNSSTSSTPEVRPLKTLLGDSAPSLHLNRNTPPNQSPVGSRGQSHPQQFHDKKFDLLSDLGGDIFAPPPNVNPGTNSSFANFAHFNNHTRGSIPVGPGSVGVGGLSQKQKAAGDRYAALAELDNVFGPSVPAASVYNAANTSQSSSPFGSESGTSTTQAQQAVPSVAQGFGGQSTNPFVAPVAATNPFQSSSRAANVAAAATFGTGSMSMPSGFGNAAAYNLPTSFSGTFQQQFPGQTPFPQPPAFPQQPNGGSFSAFGQAKPVVTPFGQVMAGPMVSSNPFVGAGPPPQYPAAGSSTNPFL
ncbi:arf-GAP domain and FG repeat-containing protein 1a isoform X4 [Synchiropus splendidus]|uniref:arf-GAP domain and FG repeat-containing protein 1a isoform X4 n=1 Tax=Synchiropus splendidus TaxID=270530 RepID=UPI00237D5453|nr:arf-GAP domain and FG repeat-containing protein 1a isoform X4 [Synchiropus splendidus]